MKNKKIEIIIFFIIIIIPIEVFANTLTIKLITEKEEYSIGDNVNVTVNWEDKMQAVGFILKYDATKIEFCSASISDVFYNNDNKGTIEINWASFEDKDCKSMTFTFKTIVVGECAINILNPNSFANGDLESPTDYEYKESGSKTIKIVDNNAKDSSSDKGNIDKTTASGRIPQTGISGVIVFSIIVLIISGIIIFKKYNNLSDI